MEGAQDAQAILGKETSRFYLDLVTTATSAAKGGRWVGLAGGAIALSLAVGHLPGLAVAVAIGSLGVARLWGPATTVRPVGRLLFFSDKLVLLEGDRQTTFPLASTTQITLRYQGYQGERLGPRAYASGHGNTIQLAAGPTYHFAIGNEAMQNTLRAEFKNWYLRQVNLKEYRLGSRTLLLHSALTYEQLQRYKQELGVSLYD